MGTDPTEDFSSAITRRRVLPEEESAAVAFAPPAADVGDDAAVVAESVEPPAALAADDDLIREQLCARFHVDHLIAAGGMGRLYSGYDDQFAQRCVIKVSKRPDAHVRLQREVRVAVRLQGMGGVARAYGTNILRDGKTPFAVFEYLDGETLRDILDRKDTLPPAEALRIILQIAVTMESVHRRGIIHRDLSPANVLINKSGGAVVIDFGLAHVADEQALTGPNEPPWGTPPYMSPEQLLPQPKVGPQMDVYAIGMLLFRVVAGRDSLNVLQTLAKETDRRHHIRAALPSSLRSLTEVIARATNPDAERRIATMREFAAALAKAHDGPWVHDVAPSIAAELQASRARRWRRLVWLFAGAAALGVALATMRHAPVPPPATGSPVMAVPPVRPVPVAAPPPLTPPRTPDSVDIKTLATRDSR